MKKCFSILIIFALTLSAAGCGQVSQLISEASRKVSQAASTVQGILPEDSQNEDSSKASSVTSESKASEQNGSQSHGDSSDLEDQSGADSENRPEISAKSKENSSVDSPEETASDGDSNAGIESESDSSYDGSSVAETTDLLKNPGLTIGDLKSLDLSLLKVATLSQLDLFIDTTAPKNTYDNSMFRHDGDFVSYNDPKYDCLLGVDVSVFQGEIDWEAVKAQGISFAIIRAGFRGYGEAGTLNEDEYFRQNIEGAKKAGLMVGVYFFSQAITTEEAVEEADYVLSLIDGCSLDLPIVYDPEVIKNDEARTDVCLLSQFTENSLAFFERIRAAGYSPMLYTNLLAEILLYDLDRLSGIPIWFAGYDPLPLTPYDFAIWQYTESGKIDGISEPVDINIWMRKA